MQYVIFFCHDAICNGAVAFFSQLKLLAHIPPSHPKKENEGYRILPACHNDTFTFVFLLFLLWAKNCHIRSATSQVYNLMYRLIKGVQMKTTLLRLSLPYLLHLNWATYVNQNIKYINHELIIKLKRKIR